MDLREELSKARVEHLYQLARARMVEVASLAQLGLRTLTLLNGGAIVALFTLLGHVDSLHVAGPTLWLAFGTFCIGVISALAAILLGFLASNASWVGEQASADKIYFGSIGHPQQAAGEERTETKRIRESLTWWWCAVGAATLSIVAFGVGSWIALSAVQLHPPH